MQTYWDLSEKERADLTRDDVEIFADAELMINGVLRVSPLVLEPAPAVPAPTVTFYRVRDGHHEFPVVFLSATDARAFLDLRPSRINHEWLGGDSVDYVEPIEKPEIVTCQMLTESEKELGKTELKRASEVKQTNERRQKEYNDALRKKDDALKGMWADYYECCGKAMRLRKVVDTLADYTRTAGDASVAARFLSKVFDIDDIKEAAEWFRLEIEIPSEPMAVVKEVAVAITERDLPF